MTLTAFTGPYNSKWRKEKEKSIICWCIQNIVGWVAKSLDPDQMLLSAVSGLGPYSLLKAPSYPNTFGYYG